MAKFINKNKILAGFIFSFVLGGLIGYFISLRGLFPAPLAIKQLELDNNEVSLYKITKVIDGDTIQVKTKNGLETVRFLGINTPEVENKYRHEECFGSQASHQTKKILDGKNVYLLADPLAPDRDKYGRLLRYVFLTNGEFINGDLVKDGYAFKYIYQPIQFSSYFNYLQMQAKKNRLGLWSAECNYYKKY